MAPMTLDPSAIQARYRDQRERNNAASRRSRAAAKASRSKVEWLLSDDAGLSDASRFAVLCFLDGDDPPLTPIARDSLRKHLLARRAVERENIAALLARLDALEGAP